MSFIETHRSFVNTWECDENAHLNVQFYWKRFAEASAVFAALTGIAPLRGKTCHVRYHRELAAGASTIIRSAVVNGGESSGALVHQLLDASSGELSATSLELISIDSTNLPTADTHLLSAALPRSVPSGDIAIVPESDLAEIIALKRATLSHRGQIIPAECDANGELLLQYHISRFSDAAPHIWDLMHLEADYLIENGFGRVAVEMKLTRHQAVAAGQLIHVISSIEEIRQKTFSLRHDVFDTLSGAALFSGEVTGLILDLATRKVVPIPERAFILGL